MSKSGQPPYLKKKLVEPMVFPASTHLTTRIKARYN
ncbi:hypothetical protein ACB092_10G092500 [Castanea dentata]